MQEQPKPMNEQPQKEPLLPGQQPELDPHGADKFNVHPKSVVWDDVELQKAWDALHADEEEEEDDDEEEHKEQA